MKLQPRSGLLLKCIILIARLLQLVWDYLLLLSFSQPQEIESPDYADELTVTRYENYKNTEFEDSSVECAVCLCSIDEGAEVRELRCYHLYHRVCLDKWVRHGHTTCPLCRNSLKPPQLAVDLHQAEEDAMLVNFYAPRSRDDCCTSRLQ
ncbi:unnamed protein product [Fraxinus pennsylvanica]|uniref:RING-type domain-containing protein n=1 Tax=Fraxinus pennsylvanica TaxID=56036 RepID=A0AAD2DY51_9LAMI|nr:unnamed protein product [Fraxinus pennsylvanica]